MAFIFHLSLTLMAHLALDFGNTCIKAASFKDGKMGDIMTFENVQKLLKSTELILVHSHVIISSVTNDHQIFLHEFDKKVNCILFTSETPIPLTNKYKSSGTLGSDRLAASIGAYSIYPNQNVLTIDCGTCIKYNFVDKTNNYLGGGISPGIELRFKALNDHTAKLPLLQIDNAFQKLIGETTQESILSGVLNGAVAEIDGIIRSYQLIYPDLITVLTGGNGDFFAKRLKSSIFGHPNLVLKGLNQLLEFQLEKK